MNFLAESKRAQGKALRLVRKNPVGVGIETMIVVGSVAALGAIIYAIAKKPPTTTPAAGVIPSSINPATIVIPAGQAAAGTWVASTTIPPKAQFAISANNPPTQVTEAVTNLAASLGAKTFPVGTPAPSFWPIKTDPYGQPRFELWARTTLRQLSGQSPAFLSTF